MLKIESARNETFKTLLGLTNAKGLKKSGLFLLSGEKLVREFLAKPNLKIIYELVKPKLAPIAPTGDHEILSLSSSLFSQLDVLGTDFNILVLEQPTIATLKSADNYTPQGIELVMPIGDPGNLGAMIRSCEAFGVRRVILTSEAAHPFLPKAVKASAGSVLRVAITRGPPLRTFPESAIALDSGGAPIDDFTWPENGLLVVGEEGSGLGGKPFTRRIRIPTQNVESLNAVVAASVALAHYAGRKK